MSSTGQEAATSGSYKRPRQRDIARMAGVSQPAVSLILTGRGQDRIPDETRQRVLEIAAAVGYRANTAARRLQGQSSGLLGVHSYGDIFPIGFQHYSYEYLVGIHSAAEQSGFDLVLFTSTRRGPVPSPYLGNDENRLGVADGSIIVGGHSSENDLARLVGEGYPFVHIGRRQMEGIDIPSVGSDYVDGTARLIVELAETGHRKLLYLGADSVDEGRRDRREGFRIGVEKAGLTSTDMCFVGREEVTADWLTSTIPTSGWTIVAEEHDLAHRAVTSATTVGRRLRTDLAVAVLASPLAGEFDSWYCGFLVEQREEIGWRAGKLLIDIVEGRQSGPRQLLLKCRPSVTSYGYVPL